MHTELVRIAFQEFADVITHYEILGRRAGAPLKLRLHVGVREFLNFVRRQLSQYAV